MSVVIRAEPVGGRVRLSPAGPFDLANAVAVARAVDEAEHGLNGSREVELDLSALEAVDGSGAVLLARLVDRLEAHGLHIQRPRRRQSSRRATDHSLS